MLTKELCDECIFINAMGGVTFDFERLPSSFTPDEAELFAYRLLDAVKRARESE